MSGWPDPEKPGVPLHPEQNGWHWLFDPKNSKSYPEIWVAEIGSWAVGDAWTPRIVAEMGLHYLGPVLTPAERDAIPLAMAGIVSSMYRLAAKVALAALEPTDGAVYARDQGEHMHMKRAHERVKQKLEETAEAWGIDMEKKS